MTARADSAELARPEGTSSARLGPLTAGAVLLAGYAGAGVLAAWPSPPSPTPPWARKTRDQPAQHYGPISGPRPALRNRTRDGSRTEP